MTSFGTIGIWKSSSNAWKNPNKELVLSQSADWRLDDYGLNIWPDQIDWHYWTLELMLSITCHFNYYYYYTSFLLLTYNTKGPVD